MTPAVPAYMEIIDSIAGGTSDIRADLISRKHGGLSDSENLAYACVICNRNKGTGIASLDPASGELVRLYHPRKDEWHQHFRWAGEPILALTPIGAATIRVLHLNSPERLAERGALMRLGGFE